MKFGIAHVEAGEKLSLLYWFEKRGLGAYPLTWQIFELTLQILDTHGPSNPPTTSKYVQFSLDELPQPTETENSKFIQIHDSISNKQIECLRYK